MRGGVEKGVLPLMRRFNEHSGRVLSAALGSGGVEQTSHTMGREAQDAEQVGRRPRKKARTEGESGVELDDHAAHARRYEEEIVIEDLEERRQRIAVPLELNIGDEDSARGGGTRRGAAGRRRRAEAATSKETSSEPVALDRGQVLSFMSTTLGHMGTAGIVELDFLGGSKKQTPRDQGDSGLTVEASLVSLLVARRSRGLTDLTTAVEPDSLRKKLLDAHGSATEVLRHFWHAVCPPDTEDEMALKAEEQDAGGASAGKNGGATAEEREAKAKRMMGVLGKVLAQTEEVLRLAREQGEKQNGAEDVASVVTAALGSTMDACRRALVVGELIYGSDDGDA